MSSAPLKAAILIVSTTAAKDPSADASEAVLRDVFAGEAGKWDVVKTAVVPDATAQIQRQIMLWADGADSANLIVTTGGTGFARGDDTPEAVAAVLHKHAPGLVHAMLSSSLTVTPFAMMSRPVAGVRNGTVVVTLPGSPKGARENLQAIIKTLPHACVQAAGGVDSRSLHKGGVKRLEAEAGVSAPPASQAASCPHHGHSHGHGHGHGSLVRHTRPESNPLSNDPRLGPGRRHRASPYPMLDVPEALDLIRKHTPAPQVTTSKVDADLVGSALAEDVTARESVPAFRASIVDGYAVVVPADGDMRGIYPVVSVSHAAPGETQAALREGSITRITTGAPLPPGATSVIMVEDTILRSMTPDGMEEAEVEILADKVREGDNIREVGSDVEQGTGILSRGEKISGVGGELGLLAAVGVAEVKTYRRPVVGVLSTGDEIVEHDRPGPLRLGEVRDTNRVTLLAAARQCGFEAVDLGIAGDGAGALESALRSALRAADLVVTTGGVSMGELDLLKPTIERSLGGEIHFGRVNMKPGKPTTFATVPVKDTPTADGPAHRLAKPVFSLPGNPASALVTFHLFVLPALHILAGEERPGPAAARVVLDHAFPMDRGRPEYHRAHVAVGRDGRLVASSTGGQRSSRVGSMRSANALVCVPRGEGSLAAGDTADALLIGAIGSV